MKTVIIGKHSYIGENAAKWIAVKNPYDIIEVIDSHTEWESYDFAGTDAVVMAAGIVHHPEITDWSVYERVNIELPVAAARRAKDAGVSLFISTMGVYGREKSLKPQIIEKNDITVGIGFYSKSKLIAEKKLSELEDGAFRIAVVRPPNVYGKKCPGRYITTYESIIRRLPIIPSAYENVRQSIIYIDNLSELISIIAEQRLSGVFTPQDDCAVSAVELMKAIAGGMRLHRSFSKFLGLGVKLLAWTPIVRKAYGGIEYDMKSSGIEGESYIVVPFSEAIRRTVGE